MFYAFILLIFSDWRKEQNHTGSKRLHVDASPLTDVAFFKFSGMLPPFHSLNKIFEFIVVLKQADSKNPPKEFL